MREWGADWLDEALAPVRSTDWEMVKSLSARFWRRSAECGFRDCWIALDTNAVSRVMLLPSVAKGAAGAGTVGLGALAGSAGTLARSGVALAGAVVVDAGSEGNATGRDGSFAAGVAADS